MKDKEKRNMSTKLFVGSLSWNTSSAELQNAFAACGDVVEAKVITDRDTGRSRGFGFVTFSDADSATRAIEELDGSQLDGRSIRVDRANDRPQRERGSTARW
jgi:RNA recognition motif-containing protein